MAKFRQSEPIAEKRRVAIYIYLDDGVTPADKTTDWGAVNATVALAGTALAAATASWDVAGVIGNGKTITFVEGGGPAHGSVAVVGGAVTVTFHNGLTTVNDVDLLLAGIGITLGGTFSSSDALARTADEFGPLTFAGGIDIGFQVRKGGVSYADAIGTYTNTGIDGEWIYEADLTELGFVGSEFGIKLERDGFRTEIVTVDMNDAEDFASIGEGAATYGDLMRLLIGVDCCLVADFRTGMLVFKSMDGSKTRATITTDASGRINVVFGDLSP